MRKKRIAASAAAISLAVFSSVTAAAVGKMLSSDMNLEDLQKFADKNTYSYRIFEYEKETAEINADSKEYELEYYRQLLKSTSESDSRYAEYMLKVAELEKEFALAEMDREYYDEDKEEADKKLLDLALKSKYYELCGLENQVDVQRANVQYMKKYAEIEAVKLEGGRTTETDCRLAQVSLEMAENDLSAAENAVSIKTREISDFLNQYDDTEKFSVECAMPQSLEYRKFDAEKLYEQFSENSIELEKQRKSMECDEAYLDVIGKLYGKESDTCKSYSNSYEIDKLNFEAAENSYKSQIAAMVMNYEQAYEKYEISEEYMAVLTEKLGILQTAYNSGNMSELEYLKEYAELKAEMCSAENAVQEAALLYERLYMIEEGIWVD
ncbi:MAG: TolC family protein [Oscillospiraceae bacterium]|nr:TolC family protein [Oscillospiraceae bacterium]